MNFTWYGDRATQQIRGKLAANLDEAAGDLVGMIQKAISIQGPPRSLPGEPPHIDTAELIQSWTHVTDTTWLTASVGTNIPHSVPLETGTDHMAARPYIVSTLLENADALGRTIVQP